MGVSQGIEKVPKNTDTFINHCTVLNYTDGSLRTTLARCTLTVSCQLQATFLKRDRYEEDVEKVRDVTGTRIVGVENERQFERERHLEGQQEQRVQRDDEKASRAR